MEKAKRPKELAGRTYKVPSGCGNMYVQVNRLGGKIFEVFASLGKAGGCPKCQCEALTRSITVGLRYGVPIEEYIKQISDIKCPSPGDYYEPGQLVQSCPDGIAKVLKKELLRDES